MSVLSQSETAEMVVDESRDTVHLSQVFDRDRAAKIGKQIQARRILCGLSEQQLGARVGIHGTDVNAYEQGTKRISCRLLLETARQLNAQPRIFFQ
jgi:DNA-binding XRE family transcriptional regulator